MKLNKKDPNDPEVVARVLERLRRLSPEELLAELQWRPEGVEETNMNETPTAYQSERIAALEKRIEKAA